MIRRKTTREDFDKFQSACKQWIDFLKAYDWEYIFKWGKLSESEAEYEITLSARRIEFSLTTGYISVDPIYLARHEVIEATLYGRIAVFADYGAPKQMVTEEVHRCVHIITSVFEPYCQAPKRPVASSDNNTRSVE